MGTPGRRLPMPALALALLAALAAAPGHAQDAEEACPNSKGWAPSQEELRATLQTHKVWVGWNGWWNPAIPGRAVLCNADLSRAQHLGAGEELRQLEGANLVWARLEGADLRYARLEGAVLRQAHLEGADLSNAQLQGADLSGAWLEGADLRYARLEGANLAYAQLQGAVLVEAQLQDASLALADFTDAIYAPVGVPDSRVEGITGLSTVTIPYWAGEVNVTGLVQLRELLQEAGLRNREREATYAIERNRTHHLFFRRLKGQLVEAPRWNEPLKLLEGGFRLMAFQWPVAYGLYPGRALLILLGSIGGFALLYLVPLSVAGSGGIHRVWPAERLEARSRRARLTKRARVERLRPRGWWGLKWLLHALQFSILSAFHLGFREINVGSWIARVQAQEYTLRATGWVRVVAGLQSLLSIYLIAIWVLTYFGRPFQ